MPGSVRVTWHGDEVAAGADRGARRGLGNAGEHLLVESNREVPLREGILQDSGRVEVDTAALSVAVSYDTPYAEVQHEREDFNHPNGRKDHYLSDPAEREGDVMLALVASAVRAGIAGAAGATTGRRRRR